jgi:BMFP domain-containing protein YqiC
MSPPFSDRPKFFDDLAGVAGGALSAVAGLREEISALVRARVEEALRRLDLVRREEFDAVAELAARARAQAAALEARVAALEARGLETSGPEAPAPGVDATEAQNEDETPSSPA